MVATVGDLLAGIAQLRRVDLCISSDEKTVVANVHPAQIQQLLVAMSPEVPQRMLEPFFTTRHSSASKRRRPPQRA